MHILFHVGCRQLTKIGDISHHPLPPSSAFLGSATNLRSVLPKYPPAPLSSWPTRHGTTRFLQTVEEDEGDGDQDVAGGDGVVETGSGEAETARKPLADLMRGELVGVNCDFSAVIEVQVCARACWCLGLGLVLCAGCSICGWSRLCMRRRLKAPTYARRLCVARAVCVFVCVLRPVAGAPAPSGDDSRLSHHGGVPLATASVVGPCRCTFRRACSGLPCLDSGPLNNHWSGQVALRRSSQDRTMTAC